MKQALCHHDPQRAPWLAVAVFPEELRHQHCCYCCCCCCSVLVASRQLLCVDDAINDVMKQQQSMASRREATTGWCEFFPFFWFFAEFVVSDISDPFSASCFFLESVVHFAQRFVSRRRAAMRTEAELSRTTASRREKARSPSTSLSSTRVYQTAVEMCKQRMVE